jgi:hypothetical protein
MMSKSIGNSVDWKQIGILSDHGFTLEVFFCTTNNEQRTTDI